MNGPQLHKRWRRNAFMRATLEREIRRVRLDADARPGHLEELEQNLRKYTVHWRNSKHPESDTPTFWGLVARLKIKQAVEHVVNRRRAAKAARRINRKKQK